MIHVLFKAPAIYWGYKNDPMEQVGTSKWETRGPSESQGAAPESESAEAERVCTSWTL